MRSAARFVTVGRLASLLVVSACSGATGATEAATSAGVKADAGHADARGSSGGESGFGGDAATDVYLVPPTWTGGAAKVLASGVDGIGIAVDESNVYAQGAGGAIFACPLAGCSGEKPTQLSALIGSTDTLETVVASGGVATFLTSQGGSISSVPFAQPKQTSTDFETTGTIGALITDGSSVYFTNNVPTDGGSNILSLDSCPITGDCSSPVTLYAPGPNDDIYALGPISVVAQQVFFVVNGDNTSIDAVGTGGGTPQVICTSSMLEGVQSILAVGGYVYFTSSFDSTSIYACPASGGEAKVFLEDYAPYALATDGTNLYWTNYVPTTGTVATCALGAKCSNPLTVASKQDAPFAITASTNGVYWTTGTSIIGATAPPAP
jgi:hypothetical protein